MNLFNNILIKIDLFSDKFLQENVLFSPKFCSKMCTKLTTVVSQKSPDFEKKSCFFADFPVTINFSFFKVSCYAGGILPPETPPTVVRIHLILRWIWGGDSPPVPPFIRPTSWPRLLPSVGELAFGQWKIFDFLYFFLKI